MRDQMGPGGPERLSASGPWGRYSSTTGAEGLLLPIPHRAAAGQQQARDATGRPAPVGAQPGCYGGFSGSPRGAEAAAVAAAAGFQDYIRPPERQSLPPQQSFPLGGWTYEATYGGSPPQPRQATTVGGGGCGGYGGPVGVGVGCVGGAVGAGGGCPMGGGLPAGGRRGGPGRGSGRTPGGLPQSPSTPGSPTLCGVQVRDRLTGWLAGCRRHAARNVQCQRCGTRYCSDHGTTGAVAVRMGQYCVHHLAAQDTRHPAAETPLPERPGTEPQRPPPPTQQYPAPGPGGGVPYPPGADPHQGQQQQPGYVPHQFPPQQPAQAPEVGPQQQQQGQQPPQQPADPNAPQQPVPGPQPPQQPANPNVPQQQPPLPGVQPTPGAWARMQAEMDANRGRVFGAFGGRFAPGPPGAPAGGGGGAGG